MKIVIHLNITELEMLIINTNDERMQETLIERLEHLKSLVAASSSGANAIKRVAPDL